MAMENNQFTDLYRWLLYSSKFINFTSRKTMLNSQLIEEFCAVEGIQEPETFKVINQGSVLMMLFGLFVMPKEFWKKAHELDESEDGQRKDSFFDNFDFKSRTNFKVSIPMEELPTATFLRRFRNALVHSHIEIDKKKGCFIFKNYTQSENCNFEAQIDVPGLGEFVEEITGFFIKHPEILQHRRLTKGIWTPPATQD